MMKKKKILVRIGLALVAVLVIARIAAPPVILSRLNAYLAEFSPLYSAHIEDLDIALWRMAYGFNGIELKEKQNGKIFLKVRDVDVSLSWRELVRGRILTDIDVKGARMDFDRGIALLTAKNPDTAKANAKDAKETLFPVSIERLRIQDSDIAFRPPKAKDKDAAWKLTDIEATASNLTPKTAEQKTFFVGSGALQGTSRVKLAGEARLKAKPIEWSVDTELKDFDLREANPILIEVAPLTFEKGSLDLYSEVRSKAGAMLGYVRPIAKDLKIVGDPSDFKEGPRQFLVEIVAQIAQFIVRDRGTQSVATQIDFGTIDGAFKVNTGKAIGGAIRHGFGENVKAGVDNRLDISDKPKEKAK